MPFGLLVSVISSGETEREYGHHSSRWICQKAPNMKMPNNRESTRNYYLGEINAKVGREQDREIVGKYWLGSYNECGEKWVH